MLVINTSLSPRPVVSKEIKFTTLLTKIQYKSDTNLFLQNTSLNSSKRVNKVQRRNIVVCKSKSTTVDPKLDYNIDDVLKFDKAPPEKCMINYSIQSDSKLKMTISVPKPVVKWVEACTYEHLNQQLKTVPERVDFGGFRAGKLPRSQLIQTLGRKFVDSMIVTCMTNSCFDQIKECAPENVVDGSVNVLDQDQLVKRYQPGQDFDFEIEMDLQPSIKWLGDYKSIRVQVKDVMSMVNFEQKAKETIRTQLKPKGQLREVNDRGVKKDDVVVMSFLGERADTGEMVPGMNRSNFQHDLEDPLIPGFEDNLVGTFKGEQTGFQLVFPQNWEPKFMAGVQLRFKVTIHEIFEYDLPEMTDELASELSSGFCQEKDNIQTYFQEQLFNRVEQDQMTLVLDELSSKFVDLVELKIPEHVINETGKIEYEQKLIDAMSKGQIGKEVVKQMFTQELIKDYCNKNKATFERNIKTQYAIDDIIEKENIKIEEEEVKKKVQEIEPELKKRDLSFDTFLETELLNAKMYFLSKYFCDIGAVEFV